MSTAGQAIEAATRRTQQRAGNTLTAPAFTHPSHLPPSSLAYTTTPPNPPTDEVQPTALEVGLQEVLRVILVAVDGPPEHITLGAQPGSQRMCLLHLGSVVAARSRSTVEASGALVRRRRQLLPLRGRRMLRGGRLRVLEPLVPPVPNSLLLLLPLLLLLLLLPLVEVLLLAPAQRSTTATWRVRRQA